MSVLPPSLAKDHADLSKVKGGNDYVKGYVFVAA